MECPKCRSENPDASRFCSECGTQLPPAEEISAPTKTLETPAEELTRGTTFAERYEVIEELGKGGMGSVYRVFDKKLKEEVALKLIKPEIASDKKTLERFSNELKIARKIVHKNVGRMYELMEAEGTHFITMEYISGEDLKSFIRRSRQLTAGTTISLAKQVGEGLAEAHKLGVVHRDLKPQNIMIDKDGNARIMDFGIARTLKEKGITGAGVMIGTPEYMSPEQAEAKAVDQRSDIYSLGVILYEMVTGRVPFEGDTPLSIAMKHKSEMPRKPTELNSQVPEDVSRLIMMCMEKDKEKRYQNVEELLAELTKIEEGVPTPERIVPKRKPTTSEEIAVVHSLLKLVIPALAVIAVIIAAVIIWQNVFKKEAVPPALTKPSIAVLPFEDLSPHKDQSYLCDGLAESLINALTHIQDLRIPARTSSFSFKEKQKDIQEIGQKLNVKAVLEGSVQKSGNRIRITAQLINVDDESLIWSEQYNRELDDVFGIQDDITLAIVDKLKVNLLGGEKAKLLKRYTENAKAYELYLKGRFFWGKRTHEAMEKGIGYFQAALELDPKFTLAYAGIADCYASIGWYAFIPRDVAYGRAKEAAEKAIQIDDTVSEAHVSLANVQILVYWDWEGAEKSFQRALELNPSNAEAHHQYAHLFTMKGQVEDGITEMEEALELEPLSAAINSCLGQNLYFARKYDAAIEQLKKAIEMDPDYADPYGWLGMAHLNKGNFDQAVAMFQKGTSFPRFKTRNLGALGYAYAIEGKRDEAKNILQKLRELSKEQYLDPCYMAWIYTGLGEKDQAFEWLEKGYEERSNWMVMLKTDPFFDILRPDPRFKALLKKMGLDK